MLKMLPCIELRYSSLWVAVVFAVLLVSLGEPALAHSGEGHSGGFISGFLHPIFGWDHVVAMVAVGLWGAVLGSPAIWILPIVFPLVMAFGAALGILGVPIPFIEVGIALSGLVLGLLVAFLIKAPMAAAAVLVGAFAIFHGHAHGTELPQAVSAYTYGVGFVIATGLLHAAGILLGTLMGSQVGRYVVRGSGALIALVGAAFLMGFA